MNQLGQERGTVNPQKARLKVQRRCSFAPGGTGTSESGQAGQEVRVPLEAGRNDLVKSDLLVISRSHVKAMHQRVVHRLSSCPGQPLR